MASKTDFLARPDEPFSGVVLIPPDGISVVHRELMMEIVVAFTNSSKSGGEMIAGSVLVIERSLAEPVSQRVDTESGLERL